MSKFIVVESTPGYLPDSSEPFTTEEYGEAVDHAHSLADELEEQGYVCDRGWASSRNYLAIHCTRHDTVATDLGRMIAVECEDE